MKTEMRNKAAEMIKRSCKAMTLVAALYAVSGGCAVIDSMDRKLAAWGVVDSMTGHGIDQMAVVAIEAGRSRGTGVILENGLVFTAAHVVSGMDSVVVKTVGYYSDSHYEVLNARVIYRNAETDQALLALESGAGMEHTASLGTPVQGAATVTPMRPAGKSSMGQMVCKPVARSVVIGSTGRRFSNNAGLAMGDSGSPIVQDGRVVGLVRGDGAMVSADVMVNYKASRNNGAGKPAMTPAAEERQAEELKMPELSLKAVSVARS